MNYKIFFQDYSDTPDIPSHWVVQYYIENSDFPQYSYHSTKEEAQNWANELL